MGIDIIVFADRFTRVRAELEAAIGDRKVAELATLSLVTGLPLLINSAASQQPLAEAIQGCVKGSVLHGTSAFQKIDEVFFANITLGRYVRPPDAEFLATIRDLAHAVDQELLIESITLVSCNAVCSPDTCQRLHHYPLA